MVYVPGDGTVDLSIMPWLECDLECPHCQYSAGPNKEGKLNQKVLRRFLRTVDWNAINSIGLYGGEVFLNPQQFSYYINIIKNVQLESGTKKTKLKPMWCISNGTFTRATSTHYNTVVFAHKHNLTVHISTTPYHKEYQDERRARSLITGSQAFCFKKDDTKKRLLPMGRNYTSDWYCTRRCQRLERLRLAIKPNGDVIYQKCDGVYPVVANIGNDRMTWQNVMYLLKSQFKCPQLEKDVDYFDLGEPSWNRVAKRRLDPLEQSL